MRRRAPAVLLLAVVVALGAAVAGAGMPAGAQTELPSTSVEPVPIQPIIPRPNSGDAPESATDPGGWAQYAVLGGIVVALGAIVLFIRRDARRRSGDADQHP